MHSSFRLMLDMFFHTRSAFIFPSIVEHVSFTKSNSEKIIWFLGATAHGGQFYPNRLPTPHFSGHMINPPANLGVTCWLALLSATSINIDFLNQIRYFSVSQPSICPHVARWTPVQNYSTFKIVEVNTRNWTRDIIVNRYADQSSTKVLGMIT